MADPGALYAVAHMFYWDFRRLAEGVARWRVNKAKQERLEAELDGKTDAELQEEMRQKHQQTVEEETDFGLLKVEQREDRLTELERASVPVNRGWLRRRIAEDCREEHRFPGEAEVVTVLLEPTVTAQRVREICREAVMSRRLETEPGVFKDVSVSAWPIPTGGTLPTYLSQHAEQFVEALRDRRFPRCDVSVRPSTRLKQFWFLSRALAGATYGITTRTAINLVGSLRPEEMFAESRGAKPARQRMRKGINSATNTHS